MSLEISVELHSTRCACRGGTWASVGGASAARCGDAASELETAVLSLQEWKTLGKPATLEEYEGIRARAAKGERRQFQRFHAVLKVRLSRPPDFRSAIPASEETVTEIIATGGALVRTRLAVSTGDTVVFELPPKYKTRAEVGYVAPAEEGADRYLRVGLRFLDTPLPDGLIPPGAKPV